MRRLQTVLAFVLMLMMLWIVVPAHAALTTEDVDRMFIGSFDGDGFGSRWERTAYGRGAATDITESAWLDGHEYSLRIMSDGTGVAEVSLFGWFPDLKMNPDASFPLGLDALTACVYAVDKLVPTGNASYLVSPYDIYEVLRAGKFYDTYGFTGWTILEISVGRIEASHDCGAYLIMSVNGSTFNFTYTSQ